VRLLLVSDEESAYLWDYYVPGRLDGYDAILSAGDLKASYLSFLVTMGKAPVYYIHGNHDGYYDKEPPEGCISLEDKIIKVGNLRVLGLGGSRAYNHGPYQYTEKEMEKRIRKLKIQLLWHKGVDVVVSHAPAAGCGDMDTQAHRGFEAFWPLIRKYKPKYWVYGHTHKSYGANPQRVIERDGTVFINACERYVLDIPDPKEN